MRSSRRHGRPNSLDGVSGLGSDRHRALIGEILEFYKSDPRVRAVAVFGSVAAGTWHELSDVDLDVVIEDGAVVVPAAEVEAMFESRAAIVLASDDSADVVLDSLEEISIRWHSLASTSPNISASLQVVTGSLSSAEITEAARANRTLPDHQKLLDALVRDAIGAWKALRRGDHWSAAAAVERMRASLVSLRGGRNTLKLDPGNVEDALARVLAETRASFDLGSTCNALLDRICTPPAAGAPRPLTPYA
jgi:predicted nucleotidyltransferase